MVYFFLPYLGIGFASIAVSFLVSVYYNVIMAWSLFYFYQAFKKDIPWVGCHHPWNTPNCYVYNASNPNASGASPSREFHCVSRTFPLSIVSRGTGYETLQVSKAIPKVLQFMLKVLRTVHNLLFYVHTL